MILKLVKRIELLSKTLGEERFAKLESSVHDLSRCNTFEQCQGEYKQEVYDQIYANHMGFWYQTYCR